MNIALVGVIGSLLLLGGGVALRNSRVTAAALVAFVALAIVVIPLFIAAVQQHDDAAVSAFIGLYSASAIAAAALVLWRSTRRYPAFSAAALLVVGTGAALLFAFT